MSFKVSNETKVGAIAVVVITLLILGFNFLKGNQLFSNNLMLYAKYDNVQGLTPSSPVIINGLQVGTVKAITNDKNMRELVVSFSIKKDFKTQFNNHNVGFRILRTIFFNQWNKKLFEISDFTGIE
jgi:phospholipid/cholesterol/gamma-HCH transport system substrate-binding protein